MVLEEDVIRQLEGSRDGNQDEAQTIVLGEVKEEQASSVEWCDISGGARSEFYYESSKGTSVYVSKGYAYRLNRDGTPRNGRSYRCVRHSCKGRIYVKNNEVSLGVIHNHAPDPTKYEVRHMIGVFNRRAVNSNQSIRSILQEEKALLSAEALARVPKLATLKRTVQRKRQKQRAQATTLLCDK